MKFKKGEWVTLDNIPYKVVHVHKTLTKPSKLVYQVDSGKGQRIFNVEECRLQPI